MAGSVNKVILIGNLGADPEVRTLTNGTKVARIRIATSESYTKDGERITNTEWHSVNLWRGLADIAERYLEKGKSVYIEGKLRTRSYDDKEGITRYVTEIEADQMTMLGGRNDGPSSGGGSNTQESSRPQSTSNVTQPQSPSSPEEPMDDDLPF